MIGEMLFDGFARHCAVVFTWANYTYNLKHTDFKLGADPAAVARDAILYATSHKIDVVLIDTAGRIQINKNLMDEISKVIRVIKPNLKLFVGDALAGNDTMSQANEFMNTTDFDAFILNKVDADVKGGVSLSLIHLTKKPLLFIGVGQNYEDLLHFDYKLFTSRLFNE